MAFRNVLSSRWHVVLGVLFLILLLSPQPQSLTLARSIQSARFHSQESEVERSMTEYEQALTLGSSIEELRLEAVSAALAAGEIERGLEWLDSGEAAAPEADCLRFQLTFTAADPAAALALLAAPPPGCPLPDEELQRKSDEAFRQSDTDVALALAQAWVLLKPDDAQAWRRLATLESIARPAVAAASLRQALDLSPQDSLLLDLTAALLRNGDASSSAASLARVGQVFAGHALWQEAAGALEQALELDPGMQLARAYYGLALDQSGRDGLEELEAAHHNDPGAALPAAFLGIHWLEAGDPLLAQEFFKQATMLDPSNPAYYAQLGAALVETGDLQSAREAYLRSVELAPGEPQFWRLAAQFSLGQGVDVQGMGLPAARNAYLLDRSAVNADLLGYAHFLIGNPPVASRFLRRALRLDPMLAQAHYHLGLFEAEEGERLSARSSFLRALQLSSDDKLTQAAQRALEELDP